MKLLILMVLHRWYFYIILLIVVFFLLIGWGTSMFVFAWIYLAFVILAYSISILRAGLSSKNRNIFLPLRYEFTDDIVSITSPISAETAKWEAFIKWKKLNNYYLLYVSNHGFLSINKSSIPAQDIPEFESMLSTKIRK
jgi:hypothetical protein